MLGKAYPYYLANKPVAANTDLVVLDKYTGKPPRASRFADAAAVRKAIVAALQGARDAMAAFPPDARRDVLEHCVRRFSERHEELALALCIEAGKPIKDARGEVTRLIDTFRIAAGEAVRIDGEVLELQISPARPRGYRGMVKRVPVGAVRVHHAVQFPAQPGRAQGRAGDRGGLPVRAQAGGEDADRRADHRRGAGRDRPAQGRVLDPALLATTTPRRWSRTSASSCCRFTGGLRRLGPEGARRAQEGGAGAGRQRGLHRRCRSRRAQLDHVVERLVFGAFYQSGQSCISVQRIYVARATSTTRCASKLDRRGRRSCDAGDPKDEKTCSSGR